MNPLNPSLISPGDKSNAGFVCLWFTPGDVWKVTKSLHSGIIPGQVWGVCGMSEIDPESDMYKTSTLLSVLAL